MYFFQPAVPTQHRQQFACTVTVPRSLPLTTIPPISFEPLTVQANQLGDAVGATRVFCDVDCIVQLFGTTCRHPSCSSPIDIESTLRGCTLSLQWQCIQGHSGKWSSSRRCYGKNSYPSFVNNVLFAAAILFSGNSYYRIALLCKFLNLEHIKKTTYYQIQRRYLCPTIEVFWSEERERV